MRQLRWRSQCYFNVGHEEVIIMEKKKLLLVSVSTGIFLILVLGASILVFSPRSVSSEAVIPPGAPRTASLPDLTKPAAEPEQPAQGTVPVVSIITEPAGVAAPAVKIETSAVEAPKPDPVQKPVVAQKPAPVQKPAVTQKPGSAYWVQIGSYTMKSGADKAKANLSERGLVSVIFDNEVQGKTYYRVRVGPYVSQTEADYWLQLVKEIDGYEKSQIWKSGT
jgi:DedD protein